MSGSGGGGGPPERPPADCESFILRTHLNSPQPPIVRGLRKGDVLPVQLHQVAAGRNAVVALDAKGNVAGSITGPGLGTLIRCLQDGYAFVAVVENTSGGGVEVTVRPQ